MATFYLILLLGATLFITPSHAENFNAMANDRNYPSYEALLESRNDAKNSEQVAATVVDEQQELFNVRSRGSQEPSHKLPPFSSGNRKPWDMPSRRNTSPGAPRRRQWWERLVPKRYKPKRRLTRAPPPPPPHFLNIGW
ncbi:hypothetical protein F511_27174 [Dorcoceras hygrometricum]|uniref:Uncharacterized protein n=1 Tax=Dorcoceras hygrometricum TaxID=472368 RepID=A0A2Z7DCN9_9LAMI|nr:hypothetical protein F511_27174 [Dorcoceras hygrometricum]